MKSGLFLVFVIGLAAAAQSEKHDGKDVDQESKCESCVEFFEILKELTGSSNCTDQFKFAQNVEFACEILKRDNNTESRKEVCHFVRKNAAFIYNYIRRVDRGVIKPDKNCALFFRCDKPNVPTTPGVPEITTEVPEVQHFLGLRSSRI